MHQFVAKILQDDVRNSYDFFNGVILELGGETPSRSSGSSADEPQRLMGCLFTVRCRLHHENTAYESSVNSKRGSSRTARGSTSPGAAPQGQQQQQQQGTVSSARQSAATADATLRKFDLDHDEPAFQPPSLTGSFSSAPSSVHPDAGQRCQNAMSGVEFASTTSTSLTSSQLSHAHTRTSHPGSSQPVPSARTVCVPSDTQKAAAHSDPLAVLDADTAAAATTEDFIAWAPHDFLRENLPAVYKRIGGGEAGVTSPRQSTSGQSAFGSPVATQRSSNVFTRDFAPQSSAPSHPSRADSGSAAVLCVRASDVLSAEVETVHVTARDRRIHAVTLSARDYCVNLPTPAETHHLAAYPYGTNSTSSDAYVSPTFSASSPSPATPKTAVVCRTVRHRFIFQSGGMTRFLSAVKALAPGLSHPGSLNDDGGNSPMSPVMPRDGSLLRQPSLDEGRGSTGRKGPLEGSFGVNTSGMVWSAGPPSPRPTDSSLLLSPAPPPPESSKRAGNKADGKRWRGSWPAWLGRMKSSAGGTGSDANLHNEDHNMHEMTGVGTSPTLAVPRQPDKNAPVSSGRGEGKSESHSSESSFQDLGELEAARSMIPIIRFSSSRGTATLAGRARLGGNGGASDEAAAFTPLSEKEWRECFDGAEGGVLNYKKFDRAREAVYRCGIASSAARIRFEVWMYLLDVFAPNSTEADREATLARNRTVYDTLTMQWSSMLPEQIANFRAFRDHKHAIDKDVFRTDRTLAVYRKDDSPHLKSLQRILMAHVQYNFDAGYSQGMSDVASVAVVLVHLGPKLISDWITKTMERERAGEDAVGERGATSSPPTGSNDAHSDSEEDEELLLPREAATGTGTGAPSRATRALVEQLRESAGFLCFRAIIRKHMVQNFSMDATRGMPTLLRQVQILARHFVPQVYAHLRTCMADDMSFCFRWLLVCFKREFTAMDDSIRLWDTIFGCPYTSHFEVIVCVALLVHTGSQIREHLHSCDMVLKFANNLAGNVRVEDVLRCAVEFYDTSFVEEVARLESILQGAYVPPRQPTVDEAVKLCITVDGDLPPR